MPRTRTTASKSPANSPGNGKTGNCQESSSQNSVINTSTLLVDSEEFIPLTCVSVERKGGSVVNKSKNNSLTTIIEDNEDFIPLICPATSTNNGGRKPHSLNVCERAVSSSAGVVSETIVIDDDDDDDDTVCCVSDVNEGNLINDSIEIIAENSGRKNCNRKRKFDDSIEICLESCNSKEHSGKRPKITSTSTVQDKATFPGSSCTSDKNKSNRDDDDDIVIIDSVDKRDELLKVFSHKRVTPKMKNRNSKKKMKKRKEKEGQISNYQNSTNNQNLTNNQISTNNPNFTNKQSSPNKKNPTHDSSMINTNFIWKDCFGNVNKETNSNQLSSYSNFRSKDVRGGYQNSVGSNIYNPNPVEKTGLRTVVIDGSNVAFSHGDGKFSPRGLQICVDYFLQRGHMVVTFVPSFRMSKALSEDDRKILEDLKTRRILRFTPSRQLHRQRIVSYDDRFIVQCAAELGGVVVSNDNYRDLAQEKNDAMRETIERRLLMFTFYGDILMFPDNPCGRDGPRLEEFLRFPP